MENKFKKFRDFSSDDNYSNNKIVSINKRVFIGNKNLDLTFTKVKDLNYKFKRKSKNFFCWLEDVKNVHYTKTEGVIIN
jgi:hypothetical protein|tara:strand:- start:1952 stop:2188 length:237 start_codon:yes stop_codon:yes gene_type:complete